MHEISSNAQDNERILTHKTMTIFIRYLNATNHSI